MARKIIALAAVMMIAACAAEQKQSQRETRAVRFQAFGDPAELVAYKELIAAFEKSSPGAPIEFITVGKQKDHMAKLTTGFAAGDPPDLFLINFRRFGQFAEKGVLKPAGPALTARGKFNESDFYPQPLEAFRFDGTLACVPQNVSSLVVYYNAQRFAEAGLPTPSNDWTWADFLAAAKALTRDSDGDGRVDVYGLGFEPTLIRVAPFVWQAGGEVVDDTVRPTRFTLDSPAAVEALDFIRSWRTSGVVPTLAENKSEDHESRFTRGGLGMILHSRRFAATLRGVKDLQWDVAPLPRGKNAATVLHADAYCVAKSSPVKDRALQFIEYALSAEGAGIIARSGRTVPVRKSVAESEAFLDPTQPPKNARVFLDSLQTMKRTPNIGRWNEIESRVDPLIEEWYFKEGTPKIPLGVELQQAAGALFQE